VTVKLKKYPLKDPVDIHHIWQTFTTEYDDGQMDGFGNIAFTNGQPAGTWPYQYVDPQQIQPYWTMAKEYTLSDEMFETQSSGSFVAHQDLIAGDTAINPDEVLVNIPTREPWGCDAPKHPVETVTSLLKAPRQFLGGAGPFPCLTYRTLRDTLDEKNVSWKSRFVPLQRYRGRTGNSKRDELNTVVRLAWRTGVCVKPSIASSL
jgi:hypothetical protein